LFLDLKRGFIRKRGNNKKVTVNVPIKNARTPKKAIL
jgi:hypothetical protein